MAWYDYIPGVSLVKGIANGAKKFGDWIGGVWKDYTGQTAIDMQNQANLEMARYQNQMQEEMYNKYQSPAAIKRQYLEAGLNPNLAYGAASAGIGHAPSFDAPHIERGMSGAEKINSALSAVSGILGLKQAMYQTEAAKESSEQSAIKTLSDMVTLAEREGDLRLKNTLFGFPLYDSLYSRKHNKGSVPSIGVGTSWNSYLANYVKAYRSHQLNSMYRDQFSNAADFGIFATPGGLVSDNYFGTPYFRTRNAINLLKYRLNNDLGNKGTYGKLIISFLDLLK